MKSKIVLFGASKLGELAYEYLKKDYEIIHYCDNDSKKIGQEYNNLEVISVDRLVDLVIKENIIVMISSQYYKEIGQQLKDRGVSEKKIKIFYNKVEYLQTIEEIESSKEDLKSISKYQQNDYNSNIFSKYNLHLMKDNFYCETFIKEVNEKYYEDKNLFIIYNNGGELKYITSHKKYKNVEIVDLKDYSVYSKLYTYIYGCEKLFIHYLSDEVCELLYKVEIENMFCEKYWKLWGSDLYSYIDFNMYEEKTYELIKHKDYYLNSKRHEENEKRLDVRKHIIKNIDYIIAINEADYKMVKDSFETSAKWEKTNIYKPNIEFNLLDKIIKNNNSKFKHQYGFKYLFLVGNSATWENNHIDVFYKLKSLNIEDFGVVLPLSYGNEHYAKDVIDEGKKILGDRLIVLDKFLSSEEYYNIINQVDAVIMNHIRPQGFGNIIGAVYLGKKVYINKNSNFHNLLKKEKLKVYSIEELCKDGLVQKSTADIETIRDIILKMYDVNYSEILD